MESGEQEKANTENTFKFLWQPKLYTLSKMATVNEFISLLEVWPLLNVMEPRINQNQPTTAKHTHEQPPIPSMPLGRNPEFRWNKTRIT